MNFSLRSVVQKLQLQFSSLKEKMSTNSFNIDNVNVNESQKAVINEIIASSKIKNHKGHRYSENWLLMCILLNIRYTIIIIVIIHLDTTIL